MNDETVKSTQIQTQSPAFDNKREQHAVHFWSEHLTIFGQRSLHVDSEVLMLLLMLFVITACVLFGIQFQQLQHLLYSGLKSSAQVLAAVGFSKWRHMDEGRVTPPQVQRGVVGVVTQIPAEEGYQTDVRVKGGHASVKDSESTWQNGKGVEDLHNVTQES